LFIVTDYIEHPPHLSCPRSQGIGALSSHAGSQQSGVVHRRLAGYEGILLRSPALTAVPAGMFHWGHLPIDTANKKCIIPCRGAS